MYFCAVFVLGLPNPLHMGTEDQLKRQIAGSITTQSHHFLLESIKIFYIAIMLIQLKETRNPQIYSCLKCKMYLT
jgi:hypothetical protein